MDEIEVQAFEAETHDTGIEAYAFETENSNNEAVAVSSASIAYDAYYTQVNAHLTNIETLGLFICIGVGMCFGALLTAVWVKLWKV